MEQNSKRLITKSVETVWFSLIFVHVTLKIEKHTIATALAIATQNISMVVCVLHQHMLPFIFSMFITATLFSAVSSSFITLLLLSLAAHSHAALLAVYFYFYPYMRWCWRATMAAKRACDYNVDPDGELFSHQQFTERPTVQFGSVLLVRKFQHIRSHGAQMRFDRGKCGGSWDLSSRLLLKLR